MVINDVYKTHLLKVINFSILRAEMAAETTDSLGDLQSIAEKLASIASLSAEYHLRLSAILHNGSSCNIAGTLYACLTHDMDQRLWVYECYATSFTSALVCGTFDKLVKTNKCVTISYSYTRLVITINSCV